MADSENALPPSKKRSAGREVTRDTPVDYDDEDTPEVEAGTFKRASDEVLASRQIVKVRRQQTNSAPSANPFAGICLVAPPESNANSAKATAATQAADEKTTAGDSKGSDAITEDSEKAKEEEGKQPGGETHEAEDKSATNKDAADESNADKEHVVEEKNNDQKSELNDDESKDDDKSESEDKKYATDKESANDADKEQQKDDNDAENDDKKENNDNNDKKADKVEGEEPSTEGGTSFKSFLQLSSSQNAFTGLAGTGFTTSLFSFGSKDGSATGSGSGSIIDLKNDEPFGLGLSNNGSSGFGASSVISKAEGSGLALQEVPVETGEENEKVVFNADSVLFEFADGSWKERGKGEVKINVNSGTEKARLLMRARGNYRLILNARLYPDMKLTNMDKKGVTFACINSATEGKGLSTFALKFKDGSIVEEFKAVIMAHKGEALSTVPNTSENSPKASV